MPSEDVQGRQKFHVLHTSTWLTGSPQFNINKKLIFTKACMHVTIEYIALSCTLFVCTCGAAGVRVEHKTGRHGQQKADA